METADETEQLLLQCMPPAQTLLQVAADHLRTQGEITSAPPSLLPFIVPLHLRCGSHMISLRWHRR